MPSQSSLKQVKKARQQGRIDYFDAKTGLTKSPYFWGKRKSPKMYTLFYKGDSFVSILLLIDNEKFVNDITKKLFSFLGSTVAHSFSLLPQPGLGVEGVKTLIFPKIPNIFRASDIKDLPFLIASIQCVSDLKNVILDTDFLSKFPQNWIMLRLEKITQYGLFIPDYS